MGVGRKGQGGSRPSVDFEIFSKKDCFLSFEWEKSNFTTLVPPEKFRENPLMAPTVNNPSDAHAYCT